MKTEVPQVTVETPSFRDIHISNIICKGEGVTLENIRIETKGHTLDVKNAKNLKVDGKVYSAIGAEGKMLDFK